MREYWLHNNGDISDSPDCAGAGAWCTARRVAVIDPEDRGAVERLNRAHSWMGTSAHAIDDMQAALRRFANPTPPKPEEPAATGSIVHDRDGEAWVRYCSGEWSCLHSRPGKDVRTWAELVDQYGPIVLSEGAPDA